MVYINRCRTLVLCLTLTLLSGCGALKLKPEAQPMSVAEDGTILQPIPNPYLSQQVKIPEAAEIQFKAALKFMSDKNWPEAEKQLSAMTISYPELSGPYVNLGIIHWRQDALDLASNAFNKAIEVNNLNGDAYLEFALMLREQGQFSDSEVLYLQAIDVWPHNTQAHINLGILYDMYMGEFTKAVEHYELAQKLQKEPDRQLAGWILDTKRRQPKPKPTPEPVSQSTEAQ